MEKRSEISEITDEQVLCYLAKREDLAEKKAKIYSRLLTEVSLAETMETIAVRHAERKKELLRLAGEKTDKGDQK